jgi:D-alanine-D-alanine ligase
MKQKVAIVMGGYSHEREISIKSAAVVNQSLSGEIFETYLVDIAKEGWFVIEGDKKSEIDKNDFSFLKNGEKIKFDLVFNVIHGTPGEDGRLAAYFDLLNIKHNSCGFFEAALTFSKRECIAVAKSNGIKCADSVFLEKSLAYDADEIVEKLGLPVIVKPNRSGSSFGISKVHRKEDLDTAINNAFDVDNQILIEEFIAGTEVTVGIINYKGETVVLPITEIVSHNDFFDYDAKYLGQSDEITPARISEEDRLNVEKVAVKLYKSLNLKGITRAEYIIRNGEAHFIEVNTVPGMSAASIVPQQAAAAGISLNELFTDSLTSLN